MKTWKFTHPKQCKNCPWKIDHDKSQIPNYDAEQHRNLATTIASLHPEDKCILTKTINTMACHESAKPYNRPCIGWVHNQAGAGNNIGLRIDLMSCENSREIETVGEQLETFEETL